ncbi:MAG TPA: glycosyltransferase, partial [Chloroflexi bacterium]|nr:glycosyltransferase [Chloroflexota bacterium]
MAAKVTFSIAVPVFNEIEALPELYRRVADVMEGLDEPWELVLVDDGSTDGSREWIEAKAEEDPRVRPVIFARNFGHQIGLTAGLDYSRGQAVVVMDADLQDPPEVIPEMLDKWREGYEVVYGVREAREGEGWFKKATADLFYR